MSKDNQYKETISITFGEQAENHAGMQKIGEIREEGFTVEELQNFKLDKEYYDLTVNLPKELHYKEKAGIIIIRNGVDLLLGNGKKDELLELSKSLPLDKMAKMRGRVVNKNARWNNCFGEEAQNAKYEEGKGTIIAFKDVPLINKLREKLGEFFGQKAYNLFGETNYYYDLNKCGIGFHGDSERKIVICIRLGATMNLLYQWFLNSKPISDHISLTLSHGDIYIMSEKATGFDWKKRKIPTLRHAAGSPKYTKIN